MSLRAKYNMVRAVIFSMWKYAAVSVGSAQEWEHSKIGIRTRNEGTRNKLILTFSSL